jgi:CheY-like chemotaxis protein
MDIAMPIMDGLEAAKNIDELFKRRSDRPKIVAVTANAMSGDKEKYLNEGKMDAYISKPITSKDVLYDVLF